MRGICRSSEFCLMGDKTTSSLILINLTFSWNFFHLCTVWRTSLTFIKCPWFFLRGQKLASDWRICSNVGVDCVCKLSIMSFMLQNVKCTFFRKISMKICCKKEKKTHLLNCQCLHLKTCMVYIVFM